MPFQIPNTADAAFAAQAAPDKVDLDILQQGIKGEGVVSGCAVTAQGSPDMTLAVAAGVVRIATVDATVTSGNVTITTANATNPRIDLVVANNSGTKSVTAGTAAASPVCPAIPANSVVLAMVYVPANDTAINTNQITDKRTDVDTPSGRELAYAEITSNLTTTNLGAANRTDATGLIISPTVGTRPIIVETWMVVFNTTINDGVTVYIVEAAAGATNTPLLTQFGMVSAGIASAQSIAALRVRLAPSAGSHTYKVMYNASVGGTATIVCASDRPAHIRAFNV